MALVLASQSAVRKKLLENAGLTFAVEAAHIDEAAVKDRLRAKGVNGVGGVKGGGVAEIAAELAAAKALKISGARPGDLVIGADQILACGDDVFDKPDGRDGARRHLQALRGRAHYLHSAACLARDGAIIWQELHSPCLTMRDLSDAFIEDYLDRAGDGILNSVGAYLLEGLGVQLFTDIKGDYFSILGLPLLPLLAVLRQHGHPALAGEQA